MLLPTVSLLITRFKLAIHAFKVYKFHEETNLNVYNAHSDAESAHEAALQDHKEAHDRYVNLHRDTPLEDRSQLSDTRKAVAHHRRMIDHHQGQKDFHGTRAKQHESISELNWCSPASQMAAQKSAISARKSSSHAKLAVDALDHAEPRLGSRAHWRMGKAYLGDALRHTHKTKYETSRPRQILGKVFHH
jgi:hypothetical protein